MQANVNKLLATQGVEAFEFFGFGTVETAGSVTVSPAQFGAYMDVTRSLSGSEDYNRFEAFVGTYLDTNGLGELYGKAERQQARQQRKDERKEERQNSKHKGLTVAKQIFQVVNKYNPVTLAVRNAFRGLIALNFLGMASAMRGNAELQKKVDNMYKNMGGKLDSLHKTVLEGSKRKPLFNKEAEQFKGLGEPVTIAAMLTSAGAFVLKVWTWMKETGIKAVKVVKDNKLIDKVFNNKDAPESQNHSDTQEQTSTPAIMNATQSDTTPDTTPPKKKFKKYALIGFGVLALGGLGWWAYSTLNDRTEHRGEAPEQLGQVKLS